MHDQPTPLTTTRRLWAGVLGGLVVIAVIVLVLADAEPDVPAILPAALVAAAGVAAIVGVEAVDRTFGAAPPEHDRAALTEYRVRFFLQVAIIEAPVLLAVALAFVLGPGWIVTVGILAAIVAMLRVRPTMARLRRFDATWQAAGHDVSLERALRTGPDEP